MFDISILENINKEDLLKLIDYVEGLPSDLARHIKTHINEPEFDPSIYKSKVRAIDENSSLIRHLNAGINVIRQPEKSCYQSQYCVVCNNIKDTIIPPSIQNTLRNIMSMECYDASSMNLVEVELANLININKNKSFICNLIDVINKFIVPYKTKVYDVYTEILVNKEVKIGKYEYLSFLNDMINSFIYDTDDTYLNSYNIASIIYVYYKELGIEESFEKYDLLNRFLLALKHNNKSEEYIKSVVEYVNYLVNNKTSIVDSLKMMHTPDMLDRLMRHEKHNPEPVVDNDDITGKDSLINDGFVFFAKNISNELQDVSISPLIRAMTTDRIHEYYPSDSTAVLSFSLSDNDYGHLKDLKDLYVFTAYDKYDSDVKYIGKYGEDFYLFFRDMIRPNIIFGIGLSNDNNEKKIIRIKEAKDYFYKYISEV